MKKGQGVVIATLLSALYASKNLFGVTAERNNITMSCSIVPCFIVLFVNMFITY